MSDQSEAQKIWQALNKGDDGKARRQSIAALYDGVQPYSPEELAQPEEMVITKSQLRAALSLAFNLSSENFGQEIIGIVEEEFQNCMAEWLWFRLKSIQSLIVQP